MVDVISLFYRWENWNSAECNEFRAERWRIGLKPYLLNLKLMYYACVLSHFSHVWIFVTRWTVAHQAPLSMEFSRQVYWSGLPCPPPADLPDLGIKPASLMSPVMTGGFFTTSSTWGASYVPLIYLSLILTPPNLRK